MSAAAKTQTRTLTESRPPTQTLPVFAIPARRFKLLLEHCGVTDEHFGATVVTYIFDQIQHVAEQLHGVEEAQEARRRSGSVFFSASTRVEHSSRNGIYCGEKKRRNIRRVAVPRWAGWGG